MPPARFLPAASMLLLALLGSGLTAQAADQPASRPRVVLGEVRADTLEATPQEIRPAAERALTKDHWVIAASSTGCRLVTEWKDFRHPLARLLAGKLRARCVVDIQPLDERLTIVRFQGGLASTEGDVEENPVFVLAQSSYRGAVQDFYQALQAGIAEQRNASSIESTGSPSTP